MNTVKLMVVNVASERERHLVGFVFDAVKVHEQLGTLYVIQGGYLNDFIVNPLDTDEDLTIRVGGEPENALFHLRKVSKASQRKLLVRALKRIAKERGYTDAYIRKFGTFAGVGDWARSWADFYFDKYGEFCSVHTDWLHGTEHDPVNGHEWCEFIEAELDAL
ncbi:hypothetical protein AVV16_gp29 [Klebsiella phage 1513]|uniref:Uncharacterized protein n=1 Tax=Klebsiella phage 1513 TaxID=1610829 RepID=A0A0C5AFQ5_9CAUD|nr:hypothetical protein AVV16_gp29 [Klebsiella phage 1513]AJK28169.1 hypothetical protein PK_029 [Klebsiella phage 1513]